MEVSSYFSLVGRYKFVIIFVVLAALAASYFLVKKLPSDYISTTQIATGIVDASKHVLDKDANAATQQEVINQEFNNLTEILKLKKLTDNVSYTLILHDLTSSTPFHKLNHQFKNLSKPAVAHAIVVFKEKLQNGEPLSLYNKDENGLNDLLISMGYDERSLRKGLDIERDVESDFITVTYTSDNPELSALVVNTLCKEFLNYYTVNVKQTETNAVNFLSNLLVEKRNELNEKKDSLQQYKIKNGILNLEEQSRTIYAQILDYTAKRIQAEKDIEAYDGAIANIESRFEPKDRAYIESSISHYNSAITTTEQQLHTLNDLYVHSGFNPHYKASIDSLQKQLSDQIDNGSDKYITNPLVAKDDLVRQKMTLEVSRDLAKYSISAIDKELANLDAQKARLVPFDAIIKTYESDITVASQEYLDVLSKYNALNLQSKFSINLMQVEQATANTAEPSKKALLITLCGVISLIICLLVLFVLYYLDDNIKTPIDLVNKTQLPLLGSLNLIPGHAPDLKKLWDIENRQKMKDFKELLRSVRFEIDQELKGQKVLAITSLGKSEGKTLVATSLAYAYSAINRKVLLIDGNFNNPTISKAIQPKVFAEDYFRNATYIERDGSTISVIGNRGGDITLLEINDEKKVLDDFSDLRSRYDIVLIDLPPLDSLNLSKEWILFSDKVVGVFEADKIISSSQEQYVAYLKHLNRKFAGWILNKAKVDKKKK